MQPSSLLSVVAFLFSCLQECYTVNPLTYADWTTLDVGQSTGQALGTILAYDPTMVFSPI